MSKYKYKCCIPNCRSKRGGGTSLHVPHNEGQRKKWLDTIHCYNLLSLDENKIVVCHKHFEKRFHKSSRRIALKAYPTLFTTDEINSGHISKWREQETQKHVDNTYCKTTESYTSPQKNEALIETQKHVDHTYCKTTESSPQKNEVLIETRRHVDHTYCKTTESYTSPQKNEVLIENKIHIDPEYVVTQKDVDHPSCKTTELYTSTMKNEPLMENVTVGHDYTRKMHNMDNTYCKSPKLQKLYTTPLENEGLNDIDEPADSESISGLEQFEKVETVLDIDEPIRPAVSESISGLEQFEKAETVLGKPSLAPKEMCRKQSLVTRKVCRKRAVSCVNSLTPECQKLYKEFKKIRRQLLNERAKRALYFSKKNNFERKLKYMNAIAQEFFAMQVKMCAKNKKGRRFTLKEKLISLSIMKQSLKAYRFLQNIFVLPSETTLKKMTAELRVKSV